MKFGPVPVASAAGAVLAHSVSTPQGRLRKGCVLSIDDIAQLTAAGLESVIVARLDPEDLDENAAADRLARALVRPDCAGLDITQPFTGRVNLTANQSGVVLLDVAALHAVNAVHPMITLATVPAFHQMQPRGLVATIKIISYGVPCAAVDAACEVGRHAIGFAPPALKTASLIITEIPGGPGDKGKTAIANRLTALDVDLVETKLVAHQTAALTHAIGQATGDLILILTGSATSDIADVAPQALRDAGGQVARFGMPVDPGNLLFIGDLGGKTVIGLPGCARAPALNGADWVLSRVVCGLRVGDADIAAMGVGGLLKEIPTRPQPRARGR